MQEQDDEQPQKRQVGIENREEINRIVTESVQMHLARDKEDNEKSFAEIQTQFEQQHKQMEERFKEQHDQFEKRQLEIEKKQKKAEDVSCGWFV